MHELSIVRSLFERLEVLCREHQAERVVRLALDVGALSGVVPELLESAFEAFKAVEPLVEEAQLEIRRVALEAEGHEVEEEVG